MVAAFQMECRRTAVARPTKGRARRSGRRWGVAGRGYAEGQAGEHGEEGVGERREDDPYEEGRGGQGVEAGVAEGLVLAEALPR